MEIQIPQKSDSQNSSARIFPISRAVNTPNKVPPTNPPLVLLGLIRGTILFFPKSCPVIWLNASKAETVKNVRSSMGVSSKLKEQNCPNKTEETTKTGIKNSQQWIGLFISSLISSKIPTKIIQRQTNLKQELKQQMIAN
eukprot:TRINITY_DN23086_c0_g1_i1.p4 TRINITY_DN23086_c0_g1~~TRINITY_DN23086_c0_g1_i1.p4  ORF type:complete len:140 (-),score=8.04 TRINITY_DN23086_c0_g1_i1:259-678(-)